MIDAKANLWENHQMQKAWNHWSPSKSPDTDSMESPFTVPDVNSAMQTAVLTTDDQFEEQLRALELLSLGIRKMEAELRAAQLLTAQATVREREDDLALRRALALLHRADDTRDGVVGEGWRCKRGPSGHFMFAHDGVVGEDPAAISSAELSRLEQALRVTQKDTEEARARDKVLEAKLDLRRRRVANAANICE